MKSTRIVTRWITVVAALVLSTGLAVAQHAGLREFKVPGHRSVVRVWSEATPDGDRSYYQISLDGRTFTGPIEARHDLALRHGRFDPLAGPARVASGLRAPADGRLFVVQYRTQFLEDYGSALRERGVEIHRWLAHQANVVEMDPDLVEEIRSLPFVRAVTPFHPAFKLEEELLARIEAGDRGPVTVNVLTMRRGGQAPVVSWVQGIGGTVEQVSEETYLMVATLDVRQLPLLAALDHVQWIDRWGPEEPDMNIARQMHGADFVESASGFTGDGVRVEVRDTGTSETHVDLPNFLLHGTNTASSHGTSTAGIVLGQGNGNFNARGAMPNAFLVIQDSGTATPGGSRYAATGQLVDPSGPFRCVIQTNSVGSPRTTQYTSISQNMDQILFDFDRITVTQSQSNANNQFSRPEAWAKNIIACGGINHFNTLTKSDDRWGGASIGPAADGRIKPDLASYYDAILTTTTGGGGYTAGFGGTSGATPIVAGHLGLFYQMWSQGEFGNPAPGADPFENAPFNTTAKAVLINTASQWEFSGSTANLTRTHQGWGHPDLQYMHENRGSMLIVDESDVLEPFEATTHFVNVAPGEDEFRATMVYRDPPGTTSSTLHRINDLHLLVLAPDGELYKGNNGLLSNTFSTPGGPPNKVDTVENVIVPNPVAGEWQVLVFAVQVNQDNHVETAQLDVDYALAVSGIDSVTPACGTGRVLKRTAPNNPNTYTATPIVVGQPTTFTVDTQGFSRATFFGVLIPENRPLDSGATALLSPDTPIVFNLGPFAGGPNVQTTQTVVTDPDMCGKTVYSQVKLDNGPGTPFIVTNSQDFVVGM